jgi:DNA polymerase III epsilon subunit-like protein
MIVIDVETTGQVAQIHSILSIGAVDFSNPDNQFYGECRIKEGAEIDPIALKINGFTEKEINDPEKKALKVLMAEFLDWTSKIDDITLGGHNHYLDFDFINFSLKLSGMESPFQKRLVDTHTLLYANYMSRGLSPPLKNRNSDISSDVLAEYCGLPKEPKPHNALNGAKIEAEAISRLACGRNLLGDYKEFPIPEYLKR